MTDTDRDYERPVGRLREALGWTAPDETLDHPRAKAIDFLTAGMLQRYSKAGEFTLGIRHTLFEPDRGEDLSHADRQRCLMAVLATRPEIFPLALHTYLGLMEGIRISEIRNIFFLVGAYTGVPGMVNAIDVMTRVLEVIAEEVQSGVADRAAAEAAQGRILVRLKNEFTAGSAPQLLLGALSAALGRQRAGTDRAVMQLAELLTAPPPPSPSGS